MSKRGAIVKFCVIGVVLGLALMLTFMSFNIPFINNGTTRWVGAIGAIESKMGIDLRGGVFVVLNASENDEHPTTASFADQMSATRTRLENALTSRGFVESSVMIQGTDQIRVEVPGIHDAGALMDLIGTPASLEMRPAQDGAPAFLTGRDITGVTVFQTPSFDWGVRLNLTNAGGAAFRAAAQAAHGQPAPANQIWIYSIVGGTEERISWPTVQSPDVGLNNVAEITGGFPTRQDADNFRTQIESGLFEMILGVNENGIIPPTLGQGALLAGIIAFIVGLAFIAFILIWRYGHLGLLACVGMVTFSVIFLFSLALVDMVQLTLPGIAGIVLAMAMAVDAMILIFERIKDEYKSGKKLSISVEQGFKKSFWTIFDANITTIIAALVLFFLGSGPIQGFAIVLLLGVAVSMVCSLFVLRQLAKLYLVLNPSNAKYLRMKQERSLLDLDEYAQKNRQIKEKRKLNLGGKPQISD